ncbi:HAD hydrolase-like protein [Limosilactobacillus sp.]|jgi:phosphoglycolate phosphatase|uniref:HAD hydrolase-like protein n=1 Tax=Limosilactobacillus sp. TaxID=2773925 RepID=UPI0025BFA3DC|nr:HAD hydrolase-like protein [Limosilactobacillus sp.]MCH3921861.1 HAD hydrolase-like protein [Limosilactobacillus sp.]MCH3928632.1 HAD hydrolase-like protein [Limosilactobacillus sp.]
MQAILFDLDGTLTASGPGIIKSVQYTLEQMGCPEPDPQKLRFFIGPPIITALRQYRPFSLAEAKRAAAIYRAYYREHGVFDNQPYPGVAHMLRALQKTGLKVAVASSKPENLVHLILEHFDLAQYFDELVGASPDGTRAGKALVIEEALRRLDLADARDQVLMVGDTYNDVNGAKETRLDCWGVSYGYGTKKELRDAGTTVIIDDVPTLEEKLLKLAN